MNRLGVRRRGAARAGILALVLAGVVATGHAQQPRVPALFVEAAAGLQAPARLVTRPETVRARVARVDFTALAADTLDLELTAGRVVRARLDRRDTLRSGAQAWAGHVPGEPLSSVHLVALGGVLQGSVTTLDGTYSIEPADDTGGHVVRQVDTSAVGVDLDPIPIDAAPIAAADVATAGDDASTIDVLAVYTPAARTAAGGDAQVQARIALGVLETNTAYANSGVLPRLRLVGAELAAYAESGNLSTDLDHFRNIGDGVMDGVHARRDALGADLVVLIVGDVAAGACGMGFVMTSLSSGFASWAFSVTAYPCISPNYTFGHELGHNMGSAHAPEDGSGQPSLYTYSYGYKDPSHAFRTVMAYNCPVSCTRVLHFSNPAVAYGGRVTGTSTQHDNARSIDNAASTLANFRQAAAVAGAPTITTIGNAVVAEDATTAPLPFTIGDPDTPVTSLSVTAVSANPAIVPNTSAGLLLGGSGANRTLTVTPAAHQSGSAAVTVTVSDGTRTASTTFTLTVTAVNDAPTVTRTPAAATIVSGSSAQAAVTVGDIDSAGSTLSLSASSSNTTLLPTENVAVGLTSTAAGSRTFQVTMTPVPGAGAGTATVTLTGSDGSATGVTTFALTVFVPAPPTVGAIAPQAMAEDGTLSVPFTLGDPDTAVSALSVQATSSNATLVPAGGLALSGTSASRTLAITPAANQSGSATITVSVSDGTSTTTRAFALTVSAVNDAPVFAAGVPVSVSTLIATAATFPVTVTDVDTPGSSLSLAAATTDTSLLAAAGIQVTPVSSTATSRTFSVTLTPLGGATGSGGLSLVAHDGQVAASRLVALSVTATPAAPDAPTTLTATASPGTLQLTWTPATTGSAAATFAVHVGTSPGGSTLPVQTTTGTSMLVSIGTSGTYYARVRAQNAFGESADSPEATAAVVALRPQAGPPRLSVSTSGRTVAMAWDPPSTGDPVAAYTVEAGTAMGRADVAMLPVGPATSFGAGGVPDGTYWLRVRGRNAWGPGDPSNEVGVVMRGGEGCVGLPLAPAVETPPPSSGPVRLSWAAPTGEVTPVGYVLYAGSAPGRADVAMFSTGSTLTTWAGDAPPGVYYVRLAAVGACGVGAVSNEVVLAVGVDPPGSPGPLAATVTAGSVLLRWSAPTTGAVTSYVVEVGGVSGASDIATIETGTPATWLGGAAPPGRYFVRVRARSRGALGPASNEVTLDVP